MDITYVKTPKANLNNVPIVDGQNIFISDDNSQYVDFNNKRNQIVWQDEMDAVNENGCCNILPNNAKSQTIADGTIIVNSDGSIRTNIATTSGVPYDITDYFTVPAGDYIFSKGITLGQSQIWLQFFNGSTFVKDVKLEHDASQLIAIDYDGYTQLKCVGYIPPSTTIDTTVYPMLYDARLKPQSYVPYSMTNRELTEKATKESPVYFVANAATSATTEDPLNYKYITVGFSNSDGGWITATSTFPTSLLLNNRTVMAWVAVNGGQVFMIGITRTSTGLQFDWGSNVGQISWGLSIIFS